MNINHYIAMIINLKAKAVLLHAMEALGGRVSIAPTHSRPRHKMGISGQRHTRPRFAPGKGPPVPIGQEAGWAPEPVWTQRLQEKSFRLCHESNLYRLVVRSEARE
jgi:hypothetical protein